MNKNGADWPNMMLTLHKLSNKWLAFILEREKNCQEKTWILILFKISFESQENEGMLYSSKINSYSSQKKTMKIRSRKVFWKIGGRQRDFC